MENSGKTRSIPWLRMSRLREWPGYSNKWYSILSVYRGTVLNITAYSTTISKANLWSHFELMKDSHSSRVLLGKEWPRDIGSAMCYTKWASHYIYLRRMSSRCTIPILRKDKKCKYFHSKNWAQHCHKDLWWPSLTGFIWVDVNRFICQGNASLGTAIRKYVR